MRRNRVFGSVIVIFVVLIGVSLYSFFPVYFNVPGAMESGVGVPLDVSSSDGIGEDHHPETEIEHEIIHNETGDDVTFVEYTVTFRNVDSLRFAATPENGYDLRETTGFLKRSGGYVAVDSNPQFVFRDNITAYEQFDNPRGMGRDSWVFAPVPDIRYAWMDGVTYYSSSTLKSGNKHVSFTSDKYDTYATEDMYLSSSENTIQVDSRTVEDTEIELVYIENNVATRFDAPLVMYELQRAEELLQVRANNSRVTTFTTPSEGAISGGVRFGSDTENTETLWSSSANHPHSVHSTWTHEYIHANQKYDYLGPEMQWFHEGSANYFAMIIPHRILPDREPYRTEFTLRSHRQIMNDTASGPILSDPTTWEDNTDYERGMVVLFELDYRMRMYSDGEYDMRDTLQWMNQQNGVITYSEWKHEIVSNTDEDMGRLIDDYVQGTRQVHLHEDKLHPQFEQPMNQTSTDWKYGFDTEFERTTDGELYNGLTREEHRLLSTVKNDCHTCTG